MATPKRANPDHPDEGVKNLVLGIDLGTTNSVVSVVDMADALQVIQQEDGTNTLPSCVRFEGSSWDNVVRVVGRAAASDTLTAQTIYGVKRLIGRRHKECEKDLCDLTYFVESGEDGNPKISVELHGLVKSFRPEEISAAVLSKLKTSASAYLGCDVTKAIITVPAYFKDGQREATKAAARIAGLEVLRVVNEPTAAAIAFGQHATLNNADFIGKGKIKNILVYDFGGGTFDVTILTVEKSMTGKMVYSVVTTDGDTALGGHDMDTLLVEHFASKIQGEFDHDIRHDKKVMKRLRDSCEKMKIDLSTHDSVLFTFLVGKVANEVIGVEEQFSCEDLDRICSPLYEKTLECVRNACSRAAEKAEIDEFDHILLVGGCSRIRGIRERLRAYFKKDLETAVNPEEFVSRGAAICGVLANFDENLSFVKRPNIRLNDVTPLPIGIATRWKGSSDVMSIIVPQNSILPCTETHSYWTYEKSQTNMEIKVFEGSDPVASKNTLLGTFMITDLTPKPAGKVQVDVTLTVDSSSILTASARETDTLKEVQLRIDKQTQMSEELVDALQKQHRADGLVGEGGEASKRQKKV